MFVCGLLFLLLFSLHRDIDVHSQLFALFFQIKTKKMHSKFEGYRNIHWEIKTNKIYYKFEGYRNIHWDLMFSFLLIFSNKNQENALVNLKDIEIFIGTLMLTFFESRNCISHLKDTESHNA